MNELTSIPYIVYEQEKIHQQKNNTRWLIIVLFLIFALLASNTAWVIYECQFETVEEQYEYEVEQDSQSGDNNFIGGNGDITNGKTKN